MKKYPEEQTVCTQKKLFFVNLCCNIHKSWMNAPYNTMLYLLCRNRNLQAAIGAYYDFESPNVNTPSMSFVEDVTIGEGESVPPDTPFTKTWRIQNTGVQHVTTFTCLVLVAFVNLYYLSAWENVSYNCFSDCSPLCALQVQSRGHLGLVLSTLVGISLGM